MFSMRPPRMALFLMRTATSKWGLSIRQFSAKTLRTPPEISLPTVTPPWPSFIRQLRMTMFCEGIPNRRPSAFLPDLMAMQSSPVLKKQFSTSTSVEDSGSHPSVFGPKLLMVSPRTVTFVHSTGCTCHIGELNMHEGGCGGTRDDSNNLCGLRAGYIHHPNVAGVTVLSLGCQNAQMAILREQIKRRDPAFTKPLLMFEQQQSGSEFKMLSHAIQATFLGLVEANKAERAPASLSHLCVGLKCGGSDGFSGISANPSIGYLSDMLAVLGGRTILSEFPELCGVEQGLVDRSVNNEVADRFIQLMRDYAARAKAVHSGFDMNPSPGNIRDGLVTDAMKSAGAARKGGTSPVCQVLDYPEYDNTPGLALLCTPGNDVECVTAQVGAGANIVLFTTGLGTPTGNPITPVIKISTNSSLAERMADIIDIDTGAVIRGETTIERVGESILDLIVDVAGGNVRTKAEQLDQNDFIPWKRGVSL